MRFLQTDYAEELASLKAEQKALSEIINSCGSMSIADKHRMLKYASQIARIEHRIAKDTSNGR